MDAARTALRLQGLRAANSDDTVTVVYRRTETELPARREEVHHAKEEGIRFEFLTNPVEILSDEKGNVRGIRCIRMVTTHPGVFAGGDAVTGAATVILAMGAGRKAAAAIHSYITSKKS